MRKLFAAFILSFLLCTGNAYAQKNTYEYTDSSLLNEENANGQDSASVDIYAETDTNLYYHSIVIAPDTINAWKQDKKFAYIKNLDSLLKKYQENIDKAETDTNKSQRSNAPSFFDALFSSVFTKAFFWGIAILVVLFILYKLFFTKDLGLFEKSTAAKEVAEVEDPDITNETADFEKLMQQALLAGDHRQAVRYLFLKTLRQLFDKGSLQYAVDKTDFQYVQEIAPALKNDFAALVLTYEYIWFGKQAITEVQFESVQQQFKNFNNRT